MPETIPVDVPMVATAGVILPHIPPGEASVIVIVVAAHKADGPLILPGAGLMVSVLVT